MNLRYIFPKAFLKEKASFAIVLKEIEVLNLCWSSARIFP